MRRALLIQILAVFFIFVGMIGWVFNPWVALFIPIGFLTAFVNSAVASYKMAGVADKVMDKLNHDK